MGSLGQQLVDPIWTHFHPECQRTRGPASAAIQPGKLDRLYYYALDAACRWSIQQCCTPHQQALQYYPLWYQSTVPYAATQHSWFHVHLHSHRSSAPAFAIGGKDNGWKRSS